ncbi:hypothetical protein CPB86DRAFT_716274 [Serendipita vermifera]|nr:hypothetical protein CPB86DRAFT_716274 [Serendipita vermifera]
MSPRSPAMQCSVRVENLHPQGPVTQTKEHVIASTVQRWIEVSFETEEAAKRAITLTGHILHGLPIYVGLMFDPDLLEDVPPSLSVNPAADETRRNLYVLGLPHDFTLEEFKTLFQPYGSIEHAVILAVLDNFSRRRGFVVFSSHAQARVAMRAIHKTTVKGHQLNVSWAVVQRSSGFLDGADRTLDAFSDASNSVKKSQQPLRVNSQLGITTSSLPDPSQSLLSSNPRMTDGEIKLASSSFLENMGTTFASTLLVSNLCPWLFQNYIDIHALFAPYGQVKRITIIPPLHPGEAGARPSHAALVQYDDLQSALSALYQVNGRPFGTRIARASLFRDAIERVMHIQTPTLPKPTPNLSVGAAAPAQKQRHTIEASQSNDSVPLHVTARVNVH